MGEKETKRADAQFKKIKAKEEGAAGTAAYEAERNAVLVRTAKLRSERLARETLTADDIVAPKAKKPKSKAKAV